jgi:hypothetical protein
MPTTRRRRCPPKRRPGSADPAGASWPRVLRTWSRPLLRRLGPCP